MWIEPGQLDLTYCTNIHPGESWSEVRANIERYTLPLKDRIAPGSRFGVGLRLSAEAAREALRGEELASFKEVLDAHGLYIALINGFPYGSFNCGVVKEEVFAPDWRDPERVRYTLDLVEVLDRLLPEGMDGGISTIPLSYKPWLKTATIHQDVWPKIVANLALVVAELVRVRRATGKVIHIDIEPEPDGLVENTAELVAFFEGPLNGPGAGLLSGLLGTSVAEARQHIRYHLCACFDTCHLSVEYEDLLDSLRMLQEHEIGIGRVQVSSAISARFDEEQSVREQVLAQLEPFAESMYLHQTVELQRDGSLLRFPDLGPALARPSSPLAKEWRIHYHVPLFTENYGALSSTQPANSVLLAALGAMRCTPHLEIETYTWEVLPGPLKIPIVPSIAREYEWVLKRLSTGCGNAPGSAQLSGKVHA